MTFIFDGSTRTAVPDGLHQGSHITGPAASSNAASSSLSQIQRRGASVRGQDAQLGWVDEDGLWWCVQGGVAAIRPAWFHTLVSVTSAADRVRALHSHGFTAAIDKLDGATQRIDAQHPSGLRLLGHSSLLTAALCCWEDYDRELAASAARHARQQAGFQHAYQAVQAVGLAELGEPTMQGRDRGRFQYRWSVWRVEEVLLVVYQAAGDAQFGLSIQMDARRYPVKAALAPQSPFVDWMWIT
jgi:hypothetical protein